jgi:SAM-dependent methyltransferase
MGVAPIKPGDNGKWFFYQPSNVFDHFRIAMTRDFPEFEDEHDAFGMFIQLGHGHKYIDGWSHFDLPEWDAEKGDPLPYSDASIDGIATYHMLDHISDPRKVLREAQRVLVDGGWFVSIVPHYLGSTAHNCFDHKTEFSIDSWKNAMGNRYDPSQDNNGLEFDIGFNMIMGLSESDLVLVTQLIRKDRA